MSYELKVKRLTEKEVSLKKATEHSAAVDLRALSDCWVFPFFKRKIATGFAVELEEGTCMLILARSGTATKQDLVLANQVGLIDSDYRGQVYIPIRNLGFVPRQIKSGQRIAQALIIKHENISSVVFSETLSSTERGEGGFGHTGSF